jgi:hypothetical protein
MIQMTLQGKLKLFWSCGTLPGTISDDLNDRSIWQVTQSRRQRMSWLRLLSWELQGKLPTQHGRPSNLLRRKEK